MTVTPNPVLLQQYGFVVVPDLLDAGECESLATELTALHERERTDRQRKIGGVRNLLRLSPRVAGLAASIRITGLLDDLTGKKHFPVRAIFFDKTPEANWAVPWHQDLQIAVAEHIPTPGFGPWSVKDGIQHTQPPAAVLETMLTVRLHLDACDAMNGALKMIPGSHTQGEFSAEAVASITETVQSVIYETAAGGALIMRPLLLHASARSEQPLHRRVLHIEYASGPLPNGLKWFDHS